MNEALRSSLRLLFVTDDELLADRDVVAVCEAAVRAGATAVQLRLKRMADRELLRTARDLVARLDVPVFINDRLDIALISGAAGVHLGVDDLPPEMARRTAPPGFLIGASVGVESEIERGMTADYWGIGPLRTTVTKADAGSALGLDGSTALLGRADSRPCVLIGGVTPQDVRPALLAGFAGVAVVSGILASVDVEGAARRYILDPEG